MKPLPMSLSALPSNNGTPPRCTPSVSGPTRFAFYQSSADSDPDAITTTFSDETNESGEGKLTENESLVGEGGTANSLGSAKSEGDVVTSESSNLISRHPFSESYRHNKRPDRAKVHTSDDSTDNPYEAAVRDALHLLRVRAQRRNELTALSSPSTAHDEYANPNRYIVTGSSESAAAAPPGRIHETPPPQFQPGDYVLAMRTPDPNSSSTSTVVLKRVPSDPTRGQTTSADSTHHLASVDAAKPCNSSSLMEETLSVKEDEWKARRARLANYTARLQQSGAMSRSRPALPPSLPPAPLPLHPLERTRRGNNSALRSASVLRSTSRSASRSASRSISRSGSNMRGGYELLPASIGDNRLLSPAVDLRRAVEENDYEMFRPTGADDFGGPGLGLANPILSHTLSDGSSAVAGESGIAAAKFALVPSSAGSKSGASDRPVSRSTMAGLNALSLSMGDGRAADKQQLAEMEVAEARKTKLELERKQRREEEIEEGIERVLLAILERADKKTGRSSADRDSCNSHKEDDGGDGDLVEQAFAALFTKCNTTDGLGADGRVARPTRRLSDNVEAAVAEETKFSVYKSSADEDKEKEAWKEVKRQSRTPIAMNGHAAMNGFPNITQPSASQPLAPPPSSKEDILDASTLCSTRAEHTRSPCASHDSFKDKKDSASVVPFDDGDGGVETVHGISKLVPESAESYNDDNDDTQGDDHHRKVLGRLSKKMGGTTGVVLDSDNESYIDDSIGSPLQKYLQNQPKSPPLNTSILNSLTSAVKNAPNEILSVFSIDEPSTQLRFDKYSNDGDASGDDDGVADKAANAAMRKLCAHLLPHGFDKVIKKSSSWGGSWLESWSFERSEPVDKSAMWDNDDPEETGYRVHRFSKAQLRRIEREFERMISKVRDSPEQRLLVKKDVGRFKNITGKPRVFRRDFDEEDFQRDLEEAEKLLDRDEQKRKAEEKAARHEDYVSASDDDEEEDDVDAIDEASVGSAEKALLDNKLMDPLASNPNFPLAKPAGTGNVGELEVYHLPIIYKARQTGFEPTKDLVLQPGTVIAGQYFVQNELGSAAFSTAYRCVDLNSPKMGEDGEQYHDEVCLKVIKNTKDFFDQSLDEIKILELLRQTGQCQDNNIIEMKTFFYYKEHLIIVFELLRQNLFEFGKFIMDNDEPPYFTRQRLCYIARQCLVALNFTHKMGLVHSDIKPENILLSSYSKAKVKVIDFGSSCYLTDRQSSYVQSRSYRAPEVVLGLPYSGKIDIWSLGCVVAEMYTGQVVFQNDSIVSMLSRIESICGTFPRHMIVKGRQSSQYFTTSGLLYEKIKAEDEDGLRRPSSSTVFEDDSEKAYHDHTFYNIYQPKSTTMAARLGFAPDLMEQKRTTWEEDEKALFVDFVRRLLTVDPDIRPSAEQALEHPWILSGFNLTEQDTKYPPE